MKPVEENRKRHPAGGRRFPWQLNKYSGQATDASGEITQPLLGEVQKPHPFRLLRRMDCLHVMGLNALDCPRCRRWLVGFLGAIRSLQTTGETIRTRPHNARGE